MELPDIVLIFDVYTSPYFSNRIFFPNLSIHIFISPVTCVFYIQMAGSVQTEQNNNEYDDTKTEDDGSNQSILI